MKYILIQKLSCILNLKTIFFLRLKCIIFYCTNSEAEPLDYSKTFPIWESPIFSTIYLTVVALNAVRALVVAN